LPGNIPTAGQGRHDIFQIVNPGEPEVRSGKLLLAPLVPVDNGVVEMENPLGKF
jgi:hypothetical protein